MGYEAQEILTARARERSEIWRTAAGIMLLAILAPLLTAVIYLGFIAAIGASANPASGASGPNTMLVILGTFVLPLAVMAVLMPLLHKRSLLSLVGPAALAGPQFLRVLGSTAVVVALAVMLPTPGGIAPIPNLSPLIWLQYLLPALLLLAVQVGTEELIFRGYLQSQLAARFRSPLIWLVVPAVLFAVLHLDASAGDNRWPVVAITFLFALAAGDLTARSGTLGPALALHFVNNFGSLMIIGAQGPMQGLALYIFPTTAADPILLPSIALEALLVLIAWLAARVVLRR